MTRRLATARDYDQLHRAIRARVDELGFTREEIDDATGLQNGYTSKLLAPIPIKAFGRQSLGPMLEVLGLGLVIEVLDEQPRINKSPKSQPYKRHQRKPVTLGGNVPEIRALGRKALHEILKKIGRKGGKRGGRARAKKMTKAARRQSARKAGMASATARAIARRAAIAEAAKAAANMLPAPHSDQCPLASTNGARVAGMSQ